MTLILLTLFFILFLFVSGISCILPFNKFARINLPNDIESGGRKVYL